MSRRFMLALLVGAACLLLSPAHNLGTNAAAPLEKTSAVVKVNCAKGESVNKALTQFETARSLTIEISGLCVENVLVTRDRVTLRGADPATDGIEAETSDDAADVAVWVRGAQLVTLERLKLTGGFSGLLATNVTLTNLRLVNCRLEGNNAYGAQLQNSLVEAEDTTFATNGNTNAGVFGGSRLGCTRCAFADPQGAGPLGATRANVFAFTANRLIFNDCTLTGGPVVSDDSLVFFTDTTAEGVAPNGPSFDAFGTSVVVLNRVQVKGHMRFSQGTSARLTGVTQTAGPPNNFVEDGSLVRVGDASPAAGGPPSVPSVLRGFNLQHFSNVTLFQTSQISGSLSCSLGSDAVCTAPANVSGTSNCAQCPKP